MAAILIQHPHAKALLQDPYVLPPVTTASVLAAIAESNRVRREISAQTGVRIPPHEIPEKYK